MKKTKEIQYYEIKILKILIGDENMEKFMEDAMLKTSLSLYFHSDGGTA